MDLIASEDDSSYATTTTRLSLHAQLDGVPTCAALSNAGIVMKKKRKKNDDDDEGVSSWLQRFKKMGKRDGDARRMLTEVSGLPAVAPIKSIHQYFSFSLGAGRMRVGFLVPKKKK